MINFFKTTTYVRPMILEHQVIVFETMISSDPSPPNPDDRLIPPGGDNQRGGPPPEDGPSGPDPIEDKPTPSEGDDSDEPIEQTDPDIPSSPPENSNHPIEQDPPPSLVEHSTVNEQKYTDSPSQTDPSEPIPFPTPKEHTTWLTSVMPNPSEEEIPDHYSLNDPISPYPDIPATTAITSPYHLPNTGTTWYVWGLEGVIVMSLSGLSLWLRLRETRNK